jgi:hypothetical protein
MKTVLQWEKSLRFWPASTYLQQKGKHMLAGSCHNDYTVVVKYDAWQVHKYENKINITYVSINSCFVYNKLLSKVNICPRLMMATELRIWGTIYIWDV